MISDPTLWLDGGGVRLLTGLKCGFSGSKDFFECEQGVASGVCLKAPGETLVGVSMSVILRGALT